MKQKKRNGATRYLLAMFLLFTIAFAACGGGGGGDDGGGGGGGPTPLATGTFTKTPALVDAANDVLPFVNNTTRIQILYPATEIQGSGNITELQMFYGSAMATDTTCPNMTVKLGHTNVTALSTTFSSNYEQGQGSLTTVINNANFLIPSGAAGGAIRIPLGVPFYYNGNDNLLVEFIQNTACSQTVVTDRASGLATVRRVYDWPLDGTPDTATGSQTTANLIKFIFAGGDDLANYGAPSSYAAPFTTTVAWRHVQVLHLASDINGSGPITGIGMVVNNLTTAATYTVTIKLGHSTLTNLGITYASNFSGSPVTVASGLTFTVPANVPVGSTLWLPVSGSFTYNGTDNLIVDVDVTAASADTDWAYTAVANRSLYGASGAATGIVDIGALHTKFRFNGGTMDVVMTNATASSSQVLGGLAGGGQVQSLYSSAELGTGGTITSVSVRLRDDSVATSLTNYKLYIGNTTKTIYNIADSYASNMDENALVFSGTLNVPAGLKAGDWVTIPLSTSFTYNPTKNLSVLFTTDVGSVGNNQVRFGSSATQYPTRTVGRNDNAGTVPSFTYNGIAEVRFGISK